MRRYLVPALILSAFAAAVLFQPVTEAQGPALTTIGPIQEVSEPLYGQSFNHGFPALAQGDDGDLWAAFVSARPKTTPGPQSWSDYTEGDRILVRRKQGDKWSPSVALTDDFSVNFDPAIAENADGDLIVVWASRRNDEFALYWRRVGKNLSLGTEQRILPVGTLETEPELLRDASGRLYLAAQSYRRNSMDLVFYTFENGGWRTLPAIAETPDNEFRPNLALAPDGAVWAVWDAYADGKYRVRTARYDPAANRWGEARQVPGDGGLLDAYAPDLGVDSKGRLWVAYARNESRDAVYGRRGFIDGGAPRATIRMVVRDTDGSWKYPAVSKPSPGLVHHGDLPRVSIGPDDRPWVAWQFFEGHVDWKVGLAVFQGDRWDSHVFGLGEPKAIDGPKKRADQLAAIVVPDNDQAVLLYQRGRGTFRNRDIYERRVRISGASTAPELTAFAPRDLAPQRRMTVASLKRDPVFNQDSRRMSLYFGDLHNHLLVDDGHEGSVDQLFNFHRDRFGTDFGATTSHGDSNKLLYSELAINDALTQAVIEEGRFVTIPGFEWTQGDFVVPRAGHRHVIYETPGGPLYRPTEGFSDSIREFSDLLSRTNGLMFAHHISRPLTAGTDWSYVNRKVEPAAEIASSWGRFEYYRNPGHIRGDEIEGCSMQDVWKMGIRIGVIGGSDGHNLFGDRIQGLTGVYADKLDRKSIFDAIRNRRCYATTGDPIELDFRVNGHMMGSEITASDGPVIEGWARGVRKLIAVEIVKYADGLSYPFPVVHSAELNGKEARFWWKDPDFSRDSLYYLRVTQEADSRTAARYAHLTPNPFPHEQAWTSPVWVDRK